nr:hypothetical protein [Thermacetogenium phaeum]
MPKGINFSNGAAVRKPIREKPLGRGDALQPLPLLLLLLGSMMPAPQRMTGTAGHDAPLLQPPASSQQEKLTWRLGW